mgnify:CR=1 FL=1
MKRINYFFLIGALLAAVSCSKDDDKNGFDWDEGEDEEQKDPSKVDPNDNPDITYNYYGAELFSKETFKYGRFEAKMKMAYAPGCISSMFLYYNDSYMGKGKVWNEIDIEVIGKSNNSFQSNIISGTAERKVTTEQIHNLPGAADADYHVYTIDWTPEYVSWSVDGVEMRRTDNSSDTKNQVETLVEYESLRFNLWSSKSTAWVGKLESKYIPIQQHIDYIKVYDYDTEAKAFTERWTDDFDSFNSSRWGKGNWEMENVREKTDNVVVENGELILKLTKEPK